MTPNKIKIIHGTNLSDFEDKLNEVFLDGSVWQPVSQTFESQGALALIVARFDMPQPMLANEPQSEEK